MYLQRLDSSKSITRRFDELVQIRLEEEDYGPATKFLPIIKEFHLMKTNESKLQPIMICDDDHYYHPHTVNTLNEYSTKYQNIRQDLSWGVLGASEAAHRIIQSYCLSQIYRVGFITVTFAYLIRPSFFDSHIYLDFDQIPDDMRHVDVFWLNGQALKQNISRYVVPSTYWCYSNSYALEKYLRRNKMNRSSANTHALQWFNQSWEKDLWYRFNGENGLNYRNMWTIIYREWISAI